MDSSSTIPPPDDETGPDKRRHLRVPLRVIRVETELRGQVFFGHATNISKTGLFIETTSPKPVGYKLKIRFDLPSFPEKVEGMAEVVWNQEFTGRKEVEPGMGLKFLDLAPEVQRAIERFVEEKSGEKKL
jgi:type IV pilus assembly protein PilZ